MPAIRNSAKAIIIHEGRVLLIRNQDATGNWYICPGGGQHHGETLKQAVIREVYEETGCRVRVGQLRFVRDYIGRNHEFAARSGDQHQVEFYFTCDLLEAPADLNAGPERDQHQTGVEWIPLSDLPALRLYPRVLARTGLSPAKTYLGDVN